MHFIFRKVKIFVFFFLFLVLKTRETVAYSEPEKCWDCFCYKRSKQSAQRNIRLCMPETKKIQNYYHKETVNV